MPRYPVIESSADSPETAESSLLTCSRDGTVPHLCSNPTTQTCSRLSFAKRKTEDVSFNNPPFIGIVQDTKVHNSNVVVCQAPQRKRKKYGIGKSMDYNREEDDFIVMCANVTDDTGDPQRDPSSRLQDDCPSVVSPKLNFSSHPGGSVNCGVRGFGSDEEENAVFTERRRLLVNSRERDRMKKLNEAMDRLRRVVPHYPSRKKLSKMETLLLAQNYILALTSLLQDGQCGEDARDAEKLAASITRKALTQEKLGAVNHNTNNQ